MHVVTDKGLLYAVLISIIQNENPKLKEVDFGDWKRYLDSIDIISTVMKIEEIYKIELSDDDLYHSESMEDLINLVETSIRAKIDINGLDE